MSMSATATEATCWMRTPIERDRGDQGRHWRKARDPDHQRGSGFYAPEEQMRVVREVRPEAVSLALREFAPDETHEAAFASFLDWLHRERVAPQIILYAPGRRHTCRRREARDDPFREPPGSLCAGPLHVGQTSRPPICSPSSPPNACSGIGWCAFGRHETACVTAGALLGGNVRVGLRTILSCRM